jgi:hypothetical protein
MSLSIPPNALLNHSQPPSSQLPGCHLLDGKSFVSWNADWLGPDISTNAKSVTRTGWSLVSHKCRMPSFDEQSSETFSSQNKATRRTIVIFGTSRERGVFLTLVDKKWASRIQKSVSIWDERLQN